VGTLRFAHPTDSRQCHTLPRRGKLTEYFPQNHGGRVFTELLAATHPPRKNTHSAARKIGCLQFAARLVGAVNVRRGSFWRAFLNRFTQLGFRISPC
jgi:hypothetical protein